MVTFGSILLFYSLSLSLTDFVHQNSYASSVLRKDLSWVQLNLFRIHINKNNTWYWIFQNTETIISEAL